MYNRFTSNAGKGTYSGNILRAIIQEVYVVDMEMKPGQMHSEATDGVIKRS